MEATVQRIPDARIDLAETPDYELSDDDLRQVAARGWIPTEQMLHFARSYIESPATDSMAVMAHSAGVDSRTLRRWRRSLHFNGWLTEVALKAAGTCVPRVWKALIEKATKGDRACAKMVVERFDPFYVSPKARRTTEESWAAKPGERAPEDMVRRVKQELKGSPEQLKALVEGRAVGDSEAVAVAGALPVPDGDTPKVGGTESGSSEQAVELTDCGTDAPVDADIGANSEEKAV